jgi:hypothetical protein
MVKLNLYVLSVSAGASATAFSRARESKGIMDAERVSVSECRIHVALQLRPEAHFTVTSTCVSVNPNSKADSHSCPQRVQNNTAACRRIQRRASACALGYQRGHA